MASLTETPTAPMSIEEYVGKVKSAEQAQTVIPKALPGRKGRLVAKYRILGWPEQRAIVAENQKVSDQATQELYVAADSLIVSCVGVEMLIPTNAPAALERLAEDFNAAEHKLNRVLAEALGCDYAESDRQAVIAIFPSELALISHYNDLFAAQSGADEEIDEALVGNSEAVG